MKKFLTALMTLVMVVSLSVSSVHAQKKTTKTKSDSTTTVHTKKDGTADKRYKENKTTTTTPAGPTKKDGTADMRYKANKDAKKKS